MVLNFSVAPNQVKNSHVLRVPEEQNKRIGGFPILYIDRYSYIGGAIIRTLYGEPDAPLKAKSMDVEPEGAYMLNIGAFNSISWDIHLIIDQDHDYRSVAMAECELFQTGPFKRKRRGSVIIQNDVWIGQGVTIYGGVTIHNGAVVAGNSVVTKDVPPYCIVGGSPARVIKPRFSKETAEKLLQIRWWDWSGEKIAQNREWFKKTPEEFAEHFYRPSEKGPAPIDTPPFAQTYLFFPDYDEPYGLWKYVVMSFCKAFSRREDHGLVLFVERSEQANKFLEELEDLTKDVDAACGLYVYAGSPAEEAAAFARADYYITGRGPHTVRRTCVADQLGVPVISGADIPVF